MKYIFIFRLEIVANVTAENDQIRFVHITDPKIAAAKNIPSYSLTLIKAGLPNRLISHDNSLKEGLMKVERSLFFRDCQTFRVSK